MLFQHVVMMINMLRNQVIIFLIYLFLLQSSSLFAQKENHNSFVDSIVSNIPDSLTYSTKSLAKYINSILINDKDRLRAYYTWITHNIEYDFEDHRELMNVDELGDYVHETLITRKGKCQGFAELFNELCQISGLKSFVVSGLVKADNEPNFETHAWNVALESSKWKLFDLTYGAGYEINNIYIHEFDETYFDINPSLLIETHYPFDPVWQLLEHPVNFIGFMDSNNHKIESQQYYNFCDSITHHMSLNQYEQLRSSKRRTLEFKTHANNKQIDHWLKNVEQQIKLLTYNEMITKYNQCLKDFNDVSNDFEKIVNSLNINLLSLNTTEDSVAFLNQLYNKLASTRTILQNLAPNEEKLVFKIILLKHEISRLRSRISDYKNNVQNSLQQE